MAMATLGLIVNLAGNGHICSSPLLGPAPATLAARPAEAHPAGLGLAPRMGQPLLHPVLVSRGLVRSSTGVLAGPGLAQRLPCDHRVGGSPPEGLFEDSGCNARAWRPSAIGLALWWPFESKARVGLLIHAVFMLLMAHSILWAVALDFS
eukprot:jgi/Botrbrau1/22833/Bobra.0132s0156.1